MHICIYSKDRRRQSMVRDRRFVVYRPLIVGDRRLVGYYTNRRSRVNLCCQPISIFSKTIVFLCQTFLMICKKRKKDIPKKGYNTINTLAEFSSIIRRASMIFV